METKTCSSMPCDEAELLRKPTPDIERAAHYLDVVQERMNEIRDEVNSGLFCSDAERIAILRKIEDLTL
jgi:hypothetical protein